MLFDSTPETQLASIKDRVVESLRAFVWNEWAQMGILATGDRVSPWAQDPEALLITSLEIGRHDPRLVDEVLDWLLVNEDLISLRRLRTLARAPADRRLAESMIAWLGQHRPKARFAHPRDEAPPTALEPFHLEEEGLRARRLDDAFAAHGWARAAFDGRHHARRPDLRAPVAFAFRLRQLLGAGARAEAVRVLLTSSAPRVSAAAIARSAAYDKRNVQEAISALAEAGVVTVTQVGNEQRSGVDTERWSTLLATVELPRHVEWVQLFAALRTMLRWLREYPVAGMDEYMVRSGALDLLDLVRSDLEYAGVRVPPPATAAVALEQLDAVVTDVLGELRQER